MIDIVTVVFEQELSVLRLQAQSIELYCQDIGVKSIYVIVNDADSLAAQIDPAWWGSMSNKVRIITRSSFSCSFVENGWVSQQVLKILAASMSGNEFSMVLDAKSIVVSPLLKRNLFDEQNRLQIGSLEVYPVFFPSKDITSKLFDVKFNIQLGPGGVPFFFHNRSVREMICEVEKRTRETFAEWFQAQGMLTEFILYSGFLHHRDGNMWRNYSAKSNLQRVINICHSEVAIFDSKFSFTSNQTSVVSIHRRAWPQLSDAQRTQFKNYLIQHGITRAQELQ